MAEHRWTFILTFANWYQHLSAPQRPPTHVTFRRTVLHIKHVHSITSPHTQTHNWTRKILSGHRPFLAMGFVCSYVSEHVLHSDRSISILLPALKSVLFIFQLCKETLLRDNHVSEATWTYLFCRHEAYGLFVIRNIKDGTCLVECDQNSVEPVQDGSYSTLLLVLVKTVDQTRPMFASAIYCVFYFVIT